MGSLQCANGQGSTQFAHRVALSITCICGVRIYWHALRKADPRSMQISWKLTILFSLCYLTVHLAKGYKDKSIADSHAFAQTRILPSSRHMHEECKCLITPPLPSRTGHSSFSRSYRPAAIDDSLRSSDLVASFSFDRSLHRPLTC